MEEDGGRIGMAAAEDEGSEMLFSGKGGWWWQKRDEQWGLIFVFYLFFYLYFYLLKIPKMTLEHENSTPTKDHSRQCQYVALFMAR